MKAIKKFLFDKAQYRLEDDGGNVVLLAVDYENGRFDLLDVAFVDLGMRELKDEACLMARSLIKRKRGVNFSDNIKL